MKWNEVTWYSRVGAFIVFLIILPIISFQIGAEYEQNKEFTIPFSQNNFYSPISYKIQPTDLFIKYASTTFSIQEKETLATYPVVSTPNNLFVGQSINGAIKSQVNTINSLYTNYLGEYQTSLFITSTTTTSYKFNTLSVELDSFATNERMSHPDDERNIVLTFDLSTGQVKPYYEILQMDQQDLLNKLSDISRIKLKEKYGNTIDNQYDVFTHGTDPNPENFNFVSLADDGLIVRFSYYQIGARPFGAPEVFISYKELGL